MKHGIVAVLLALTMIVPSVAVNANPSRVYTQEDYPSTWTFANGRVVETFFDDRGNFVGREANGQIVRLIGASVVNLPNSYNGGIASDAGIRNGRVQGQQTNQSKQQETDISAKNADSTIELPQNTVQNTNQTDNSGIATIAGSSSPILLTSGQLTEIISTSPEPAATKSGIALPSRRLTAEELGVWVNEYAELGGVNAYELEVARLINIEREARGLSQLAIDPVLMMSARFKSQEMANLVYTAHNSPVYGNSLTIPRMFGTEKFAENLHRGIGIPSSTIRSWMNSPGHRDTLLLDDSRMISIGIGIFETPLTNYVTAHFGSSTAPPSGTAVWQR